MRPGQAEIESRILENASRYFPGLRPGGVVARCEPFRETSSYPLVRCALFDRDTGERRAGVVVKFPPTWSDNNEAETEFHHLTLMAGVVGTDDGPLRVPRPLDYYPDWTALVTEEVAGERFSRRLLRDASRFAGPETRRALAGCVRDCGRWLRAFHEATAAPGAPPFDAAFRAAVEERLGRLIPHGFPARSVRRILDTVDALVAWSTGRPAPVGDLHGDFGPQNVHTGKDWVCVFDLSYNRKAIVYDDVSYFLVTLETTSPWPRHPFFSRANALALREPFLDGYLGRAPGAEEAQMLEGYYLKALVFRCAKQRRNVASRGRVGAWGFDRVFVARRYPARLERQCARILSAL